MHGKDKHSPPRSTSSTKVAAAAAGSGGGGGEAAVFGNGSGAATGAAAATADNAATIPHHPLKAPKIWSHPVAGAGSEAASPVHNGNAEIYTRPAGATTTDQGDLILRTKPRLLVRASSTVTFRVAKEKGPIDQTSKLEEFNVTEKLKKFTEGSESTSSIKLARTLQRDGVDEMVFVGDYIDSKTVASQLNGRRFQINNLDFVVGAVAASDDVNSGFSKWRPFFSADEGRSFANSAAGERADTLILTGLPVRSFSEGGAGAASEEQVRTTFQIFGTIIKCELLHPIDGNKLNFDAVIQFEEENALISAVEMLDNRSLVIPLGDNRDFCVDLSVHVDLSGWFTERALALRKENPAGIEDSAGVGAAGEGGGPDHHHEDTSSLKRKLNAEIEARRRSEAEAGKAQSRLAEELHNRTEAGIASFPSTDRCPLGQFGFLFLYTNIR